MNEPIPATSRDGASGKPRRVLRRLADSDERLVARAADGDDQAFADLYDRYSAHLLSFCRYLLGSRDEAQDAVQQTFMRAHRTITSGSPPDDLRPWLYTVARNRCHTLLAARREREVPVHELDGHAALDGLADVVQRREDLRVLVRDLDRLPEQQRAALVLFELGDLSQREVAGVLAVPEAKVKALVHQARTHLIAERSARERSCDDVRAELAVARGAELRRGPLRRHVRSCPACRAWQADVGRQRAALAAVLPVALVGSREAALTALGVGAGAASLSGVGAAGGVGAVGGSGALAALAKGGVATKLVVAAAALGTGAAGTELVVSARDDSPSQRGTSRVTSSASPGPQRSAPAAVPGAPAAAGTSAAAAGKQGPERAGAGAPPRERGAQGRQTRAPGPAPRGARTPSRQAGQGLGAGQGAAPRPSSRRSNRGPRPRDRRPWPRPPPRAAKPTPGAVVRTALGDQSAAAAADGHARARRRTRVAPTRQVARCVQDARTPWGQALIGACFEHRSLELRARIVPVRILTVARSTPPA